MEVTMGRSGHGERNERCRLCGDKGLLGEVDIPYIFRYLVTQLTSCNINVKIDFEQK